MALRKTAVLALTAVMTWLPAMAQEPLVGLSAPLSGPMARLGGQLREGAEAAGATLSLKVEDDECTAEGGEAAARRFVDAGVTMVLGYLCTEAIEAALPVLKGAGIPVLAVGVRTNSLTDRRDRTGWPVVRMAPRADAEASEIARLLTDLWRDELFAIIDDGTIHSRELAETLRLAAEQRGLKPLLVDTFRPQLDNQVALAGRLRRAGATHVFVGGERDDVAVLASSANELDYDLTIAGGEALRGFGELDLPEGVLMVGLPEWAELADEEQLQSLRSEGIEPEGYVLPGLAAAEIAGQALSQAAARGVPVLDALQQGAFETAIGPVSFDAKGDRAGSPYRLYRYDGEKFVEAGP